VNKKLEKDPDTECIIDDIVQYYFSCFSKRKTVSYISSKYNDLPKKPTMYQVNRVLSTDLYAGIYRDMDNYYPAYITKEQLSVIKNSSDTKTYPRTNDPYIFSGLLICPSCGGVMTGFRKKHTCKDGTVTFYKRYKCCRKFYSHPAPCITESVVEQYMLEHVCTELSGVICHLQSKTSERISKAPALRAEMDRLNVLYQKGRITDEYYEEQYTLLDNELQKEAAAPPVDIERYMKLKKEFSGNWIELYEMLDAAHKNAFWKRIVKEIHMDKDTHKICGFSFV
jgi:hypothetical protein